MNIANIPAAVENLEEVDQRFKRWRSTRMRGTPIPEALWASAVGLARAQGLNRTARALRLDYYDLLRHGVAWRSCSHFVGREPPVSPGESKSLNKERL